MQESVHINSSFVCEITNIQQLTQFSHLFKFKHICFCGRSNVGKSTLINQFLSRKIAKTAKQAGKTKNIVVFECSLVDKESNEVFPFYLFDIPGFGHAHVSKQTRKNWDVLIEAFFNQFSSLSLIYHIQDARHLNQSKDLDFKKYIKHFKIEMNLIINKMDKISKQSEIVAFKQLLQKMMKEKIYRKIFQASGASGEGLPVLRQSLLQFLQK